MTATGRPKGSKNYTAPGQLANLVEARTKAGLSQEQVGVLIGKSPSHFSKIERGVIGLDARDALKLCDVFGLTLAELLESEKSSVDLIGNHV